jgi:hypothetical protein
MVSIYVFILLYPATRKQSAQVRFIASWKMAK